MPPITTIRLPEFKLCGQFSGEEKGGAELWLTKLDWELRPMIDHTADPPAVPPADHLMAIKILLTGAAQDWMVEDDHISASMGLGTAEALKTVKERLCARFPGPGKDRPSMSLMEELASLKQLEGTSLLQYYEQAQALVSRLGIRDAPSDGTALPAGERTLLNAVLETWSRGLKDVNARRESVRAAFGQSISLRQLLEVAREASRAGEAARKLEVEDARERELQLLRGTVARNMTSHQLEDLYRACAYPPGAFDPPSAQQVPSQPTQTTTTVTQMQYSGPVTHQFQAALVQTLALQASGNPPSISAQQSSPLRMLQRSREEFEIARLHSREIRDLRSQIEDLQLALKYEQELNQSLIDRFMPS
ncbi:hypothetical protein MaudCBS49596_008007 [Microsporum audouinii]